MNNTTPTLPVLALLLATSIGHAAPAVENRDSSIGGGLTQSDTASSLFFTGSATDSLSKQFGLRFDFGFSLNQGKDDYLDSNTGSLGVNLFMRDADKGSVGLGYSYARQNFDTDDIAPGADLELKLHSYILTGTLFLEETDLGFNRTIIESGSDVFEDVTTHQASLSAHRYLNDNFVAGIAHTTMGEDLLRLSVDIQPATFNGNAAFGISYASTDSNDATSFSFTYYFDNAVSLKKRRRQY